MKVGLKYFYVGLPMFLFCQSVHGWMPIHEENPYSISGMVPFKNGYIVVHDNEGDDSPRVSYIDHNFQTNNLIWPEAIPPNGLEAAVKIPNRNNRFIFLKSSGKCYEINIDPKDFRIELLSTFVLPQLTENMSLKGMAIFPSGQGWVIAYIDQGTISHGSTFFTAFFDQDKKSFSEVTQFIFDLPKPNSNNIKMTDLALKKDGSLWSTVFSISKYDESFSTSIYELGQFNHAGTFIPTHRDLLKPIMVFDGHKLEAILFHKGHFVLITDNENIGKAMKVMGE